VPAPLFCGGCRYSRPGRVSPVANTLHKFRRAT
jgi:hypothetical protein